MSGKVVSWAMDQRTGSPATKLVLVKLADNANEDGYCWPSVAHIVDHTELSERAVRKHLKKLETKGFIQIAHRTNSRGQTSNGYQLNVPRSSIRRSTLPPAQGAGGQVHPAHHSPATDAGGPVHKVQGHIMNRKIEPSLNLGASRDSNNPVVATSWNGRDDALIGEIGLAQFNAWFSGAVLDVGPPLTITVPTLCKAKWINDHFGKHLRRLFGEDVTVVSAQVLKTLTRTLGHTQDTHRGTHLISAQKCR